MYKKFSLRKVVTFILRPIYRYYLFQVLIDFVVKITWNSNLVRRFWTNNFKSGLLAIGEQNKYCVSPEWITVDIDGSDIDHDFRHGKLLPFDDRSIDLTYTSHMIEHLDERVCLNAFKEIYRLLKVGGTFRIEAPDLNKIISKYKNNDIHFFNELLSKKEKEKYGKTLFQHDIFVGLISCYIENDTHIPVQISKEEVDKKIKAMTPEQFGNWCISFQSDEQKMTGGHIQTVTSEKIINMLKKAGFVKVREVREGMSSDSYMQKKLGGIERSQHRATYSLYLEAQK